VDNVGVIVHTYKIGEPQ